MGEQRAGCILMISSLAAIEKYPYVAYKATKAAMIAFTEQLAIQNAEYGVRANAILPGLMDTPMAVDTRARKTGKSRAEVAAMRDARVPLRRKMGTAWDVANAALVPAFDEAHFISRFALPARIYARPLELHAGLRIAQIDVVRELQEAGYGQGPREGDPGWFANDNDWLEVAVRPFVFWDGLQPAKRVRVAFEGGAVKAVQNPARRGPPLPRLEPLGIRGLFPRNNQ